MPSAGPRRVRVVTDSPADIPAHLLRSLEISVVPVLVIFGDEVFREGLDITTTQFFSQLLVSRSLPATSPPNVAAYLNVYEPLLEKGYDIVSVHLSEGVSGAIDNARRAAVKLGSGRITIVDSRQWGMGLGWVVIEAAEAAQRGSSADEVAAAARSAAKRSAMYTLLGDTRYAHRAHHVSGKVALASRALGLTPILTLSDGALRRVGVALSWRRGVAQLLRQVQTHQPWDGCAVLHTRRPDEAQRLLDLVSRQGACRRSLVTEFGPAMTAHIGPGALGLAVLGGKDSQG